MYVFKADYERFCGVNLSNVAKKRAFGDKIRLEAFRRQQ